MDFVIDTLNVKSRRLKASFLTARQIAILGASPHFDSIYLRRKNSLLAAEAASFEGVRSASEITIWCGVTRSAVRSLVSRPNLRQLRILRLRPGGTLRNFEEARDLEVFSCLDGVGGVDLGEVAKLPKLRQLTAQRARITKQAIEALVDHPTLTDIDFEGSNFDDDFAEIVSRSRSLTGLELAWTRMTKGGLGKVVAMTQLKRLDLWCADITEQDLDLLAQLPNLEYLSVGGVEGQTGFTAEGVLRALERIPSLKQIWLDGVTVSRRQLDDLVARYEKVMVGAVSG